MKFFVAQYSRIFAKSWDEAKRQDDTSKLTNEERSTYDYVDDAVRLITAQIGGVLKTPRPPGGQIELSSTYFEEGDWKGIDFAEANLDGTWLYYTDLQDAEFRGVTRFDGATFNGTAWWEVKSINRPFLEYLKIKFPFKPGLPYGPRYESCSQEKYDAGISRLTSQLKSRRRTIPPAPSFYRLLEPFDGNEPDETRIDLNSSCADLLLTRKGSYASAPTFPCPAIQLSLTRHRFARFAGITS